MMRVASTCFLLMAAALVLLTACGEQPVRQAPLSTDTPVVFTLYEKDGSGGLAALRANTGLPLWRKQLGNFNWPPVMANGVIYGIVAESAPSTRGVVPFLRSLVAVQASDGALLWRVPEPNLDAVATIVADASIVAVATGSGGLYGLDPATGAQRWHIGGSCGEELVTQNGVVYASIEDPTSLPPNGISFGAGIGLLVAVRASDGAMLWQTPYNMDTRVLAANDHTVFGSMTGAVVAFDAHTGENVAAFPNYGMANYAEPGAVKGYVMAAGETVALIGAYATAVPHLRAVSAVDGRVLWDSPVEFGADAEFPTTVRLTNDLIIGGDGSQILAAVRLSDGSVAWRLPRFGDHGVGTLSETKGVVFATLESAHPEEGPCLRDCTPNILAVDAATGAIYWQREELSAQWIVATDQP
jgi:outer membrane protein assembly factor BamB